jgi:hypothetical protein
MGSGFLDLRTGGYRTCLAYGGSDQALSRRIPRGAAQSGVPGPIVGADAEIDIIQAGTELAEFYQLSQAALARPKGAGRVP